MRKEFLYTDSVFIIHDFLSPKECDDYIARGEEIGFSEAPVTTFGGPQMRKDIRNNTRVMLDDPELSAQIFERARHLLPEQIGSWHLHGFNERWRFYRYDHGERFAPHYDGAYRRDEKEKSCLTFMLYLNDTFTGGGTRFHEQPPFEVRPVRGLALVFEHHKLHEGAPILTGRKYVLRTDVMYRCKLPQLISRT